jgi:hypothetical protein
MATKSKDLARPLHSIFYCLAGNSVHLCATYLEQMLYTPDHTRDGLSSGLCFYAVKYNGYTATLKCQD